MQRTYPKEFRRFFARFVYTLETLFVDAKLKLAKKSFLIDIPLSIPPATAVTAFHEHTYESITAEGILRIIALGDAIYRKHF